MDFEIGWTEVAVEDFENAVRYIARQNESAAERFRLDMLESIGVLSRFPFLGPL
jgi:plasmid stabilization system protein ParE